MNHSILAPLALISAALASPGWAQAVPAVPAVPAVGATVAGIGQVKRLAGTVTLERGGTRSAAAVGTVVLVGDTVRTSTDGAVGITLADDTLLSIGPDSELLLSEYSFNPTTHDGSLLASLWRGTLGMVTGLIARQAPDKVKVQTRTVVLGVRGTEFIVEAQGGAR